MCRNKWGSANSVERLWWDWSQEELAKYVDRLEYGERNVPDMQLNCGLSTEDVDGFLENLIQRSVLLPPEGYVGSTLPVLNPSTTPNPSKSIAHSANDVSSWLHDLQNQRPFSPSTCPDHEAAEQVDSQYESSKSLTTEIAHRSKRPISDNSAQHPESTTRAGANPFLDNSYHESMQSSNFLDVPTAADKAAHTYFDTPNQVQNLPLTDPNTALDEISTADIDDLGAFFGFPESPAPALSDCHPPCLPANTHDAGDGPIATNGNAFSFDCSAETGDYVDTIQNIPPTLDIDFDSLAFEPDFSNLFTIPPPP